MAGLREFGTRIARMKPSKQAHSSSDIRSRAQLVSITDINLNYVKRGDGNFFVNTTRGWRLLLRASNISFAPSPKFSFLSNHMMRREQIGFELIDGWAKTADAAQ